MLLDENRNLAAHGKRDRITWARIDLDRVAALLDDDPSEECVIVDIVYQDMADRGAKLAEDRFQKIVGHRPLRLVPLECERDRISLERADPDRKVSPAISFAQDNDAVLGQQADADAVNSYTNHLSTFPREMRWRAPVRFPADVGVEWQP